MCCVKWCHLTTWQHYCNILTKVWGQRTSIAEKSAGVPCCQVTTLHYTPPVTSDARLWSVRAGDTLLSSGSGPRGVKKALFCSSSQSTAYLKDCEWFKLTQKVLERQAVHITVSKREPGFVNCWGFAARLKDARPLQPPFSSACAHTVPQAQLLMQGFTCKVHATHSS